MSLNDISLHSIRLPIIAHKVSSTSKREMHQNELLALNNE